MDPNNPIVKLCAAGIAAEAEGRAEDAKALFEQAWAESRDDFEACIAAHYLARHQPTLAAELEWNRMAVDRADRVADERVRDFYASLYLNLGHSLEKLGRAAEACELYERAAERAEEMPDSPYTRLVRMGIAAGQARACPSGAARDGDTTTRLH
jgi:tetratricopeptide (TPR) repeat protein